MSHSPSCTAAPRGGRTGGRTSKGGGRAGEPTGRVGGRTGDRDDQGDDQGVGENVGVDEFPDFSTVIAQQLLDLLPTIIAQVGNHASNIQGDVRSTNIDLEVVLINPNNGDVTPPKWVAAEIYPGALLHNTTAQDMREQPLNESFEK
ncbi:hypothetical protein Tco_0964568 [Tanacetum coccineum]